MSIEPVSPEDVGALREFLGDVDLTLAGLDAREVRLWIERDGHGSIVGSTGYELSDDGRHALIRSVAVAPGRRTAGAGSRLAMFALSHAAHSGAARAWLFSRRSGPFWQKLGFDAADRDDLAAALPRTRQLRHFVDSGQFDREVAWSRPLDDLAS
jgi:N-acetylglutamate synthase-like GNAT family acetyltransferase